MQPILSIPEQQDFETPPRFDADERREIFDLKKIIRRHIRDFSSVENKIGFLVQWGYYKAVQRFFPPSTFHNKDLLFVAKMLDVESHNPLIRSYKDGTVRRHKAFILDYFGFQKYSSIPSKILEAEVLFRCSKQIKPRSQFGGIVTF